ncbi:MAG: InlB B-repeat-containing protein [Defluviitaleaceae bacterium]|nr:InlB B-repeat-containing protein [Defluviitaleaceae bacterium]
MKKIYIIMSTCALAFGLLILVCCGKKSDEAPEVAADFTESREAEPGESETGAASDPQAGDDSINQTSAVKLAIDGIILADMAARYERNAATPLQISSITDVSVVSGVAVLNCLAGGSRVELYLSVPADECVRLRLEKKGFFEYGKPVFGLSVSESEFGWTLQSSAIIQTIEIDNSSLSVTVKNARGELLWAINLGDIVLYFDRDGSVRKAAVFGDLTETEAVYGFGERHDDFNQRGKQFEIWIDDKWSDNFATYKSVPLAHFSSGYSMFINVTHRITADIGFTEANRYCFAWEAPLMDIYVWPAKPLDALGSYTELTGSHILAPKWAFQCWAGAGGTRWRYEGRENAAEMAMGVIRRFAELDIPHSAIYVEDGFNSWSDDIWYADLFNMLEEEGHSVRPFLWTDMSPRRDTEPECPFVEQPSLTGSRYTDFTHPDAFAAWLDYYTPFIETGYGAFGTMVDFGESLGPASVLHDGRTGDEMHNLYPYYYNKTINEVFTELRGEDFVLFSRSGCAGSQSFACQFGGDQPSSFNGMREAMNALINISASGFSTWGSDIGGYIGQRDLDVYLRWMSFGAFSPLMRYHGQEMRGLGREPWYYENPEQTTETYKYYNWLRENMLDYVYGCAVEASFSGIPMVRSLPVAFPEDDSYYEIIAQYMFGPAMMVSPIIERSMTKNVVFPYDRWTDFFTGELAASTNCELEVYRELDEKAVYVRSGSVIPMNFAPSLKMGESMTRGSVGALYVTPPYVEAVSTRVWEQKGVFVDYALTPGQGGFTISASGDTNREYLLVYGVDAVSSVAVDGAEASDWYMDGNRAVVSVPPSWETISVKTEIAITAPAEIIKDQTARTGRNDANVPNAANVSGTNELIEKGYLGGDWEFDGGYVSAEFESRGYGAVTLVAGGGGGAKQEIRGLLPNTDYIAAVYVRSIDPGAAGLITITGHGGSEAVGKSSGGTDWELVVIEFTTGSSFLAATLSLSGENGSVCFDDCVVTDGSFNVNYIRDPGFEAWQFIGEAAAAANEPGAFNVSTGWVWQTIDDIFATARYTFSCWVKNYGGSQGTVEIFNCVDEERIKGESYTSRILPGKKIAKSEPGGGDWQLVQMTFTAMKTEPSGLPVAIRLVNASGVGAASFRDCSVTMDYNNYNSSQIINYADDYSDWLRGPNALYGGAAVAQDPDYVVDRRSRAIMAPPGGGGYIQFNKLNPATAYIVKAEIRGHGALKVSGFGGSDGEYVSVESDGDLYTTVAVVFKTGDFRRAKIEVYNVSGETVYFDDFRMWEFSPDATHTVTFDSNGGAETAAIEGVAPLSRIPAPAEPSKEGETFAGWYKDADFFRIWDFDCDMVTANVKLFAKWE